MTKKIVISTTSFGEYDDSAIKMCSKEGFSITTNPYGRKVTADELVKMAEGAVGLLAGTEEISAKVISSLPGLKVISRCGTGLDNVDLSSAKKAGIKVFNTPDAPTLAVAELTIGLMLDLLRKVSQSDREVRNGVWNKRMGNLLTGKKVGIIGYGKIGKKIAALLRCFECEIAYFDINDGGEKNAGTRRVGMEELLKTSDIVTVHISGSSGKAAIGAAELKTMKKGSFLVNTSRGGVVDETALYDVLKNGILSGAAVDVFEKEPYSGSLKEMDNVILTPHIGSYAKEARVEMEKQAMDNLLRGLEEYKL